MVRIKVISLGLVIVAILALQVLFSGAASAAISWCDFDLGPMATTAEERNAPQAFHAEDLVVAVPMQAVAVEKGGSNTHK